ncbi:MAG: hypothetical protein MHM6MM_002834 [Cercozoa sp. M6MM]
MSYDTAYREVLPTEEPLRFVYGEDSPFGLPLCPLHEGGGILFGDTELIKRQKNVLGHLLKSMGRNLLSGKSLVNVSLPVRVFESRSFLQRLSDVWSFLPIFLPKAAATEDPVERMKWVVTFLFSGLHLGFRQEKPFNPILGETFQANYENAEVYCEQVAHHPPISAFDVRAHDDSFRLHGMHEFKSNMTVNRIVGMQVGPNHVDFKDGSRITFDYPDFVLTGVMYGDRIISYDSKHPVHFVNKAERLLCRVAFCPPASEADLEKYGAKKSGWFGFSRPNLPIDRIGGGIYRVPDDVDLDTVNLRKLKVEQFEKLCEITGRWTQDIVFDGELHQVDPISPQPVSDEEALPSDCRYREDLVYLRAGLYDDAQHWKAVLEDRQRSDAKLRKPTRKARALSASEK